MVDRVPGDEYSYKSAKKKSKVEKVKRIPPYESVIPPSKKLVPESAFGASLRRLAESYVKGKVSDYNLTEKQLELLDEYWGLERLNQAREAESVLTRGKEGEIELTAAGAKVKEPSKKTKGEKIGEITIEIPEEEVEEAKAEKEIAGEVIAVDLEKEDAKETFKVVSKYLAGGFLNKDEAKLLSKAYGSDVRLLKVKRLKTMREMEWGPTRDEAEIEKRIAALEEKGSTVPLGKKPPRQGLRRRPKPSRLPIEEIEGNLVIRIDEEPEKQEMAPSLDQEKMKQVSVPVEKISRKLPKVAEGGKKEKKDVPVEEKLVEKLVPVFSESFKKMLDSKVDELIETEVKKKVETKSGLIDKSIASVSGQEMYLKGAEDERIRLLKEGLLPKKYATLEERRKAGLIDEQAEKRLRIHASEGGKKGQKTRKEKPATPLEALPSDVGKSVKEIKVQPSAKKKTESPLEALPGVGEQVASLLEFPKEREPKERRIADLSGLKIEKPKPAPEPKLEPVPEPKLEPAPEPERPKLIESVPFRIYTESYAVPYGPKTGEALAKMARTTKKAKLVFFEQGKPAKEYEVGRDWLLRYAEMDEGDQKRMIRMAEQKAKPMKPVRAAVAKTGEFVVQAAKVPVSAVKMVASPKEQEKAAKEEFSSSIQKTGRIGVEALKYSGYAVHKTMQKAAESTVDFLGKRKVQKWLKSPVGHALPVRRQTDLKKVEMKRLRLYAER